MNKFLLFISPLFLAFGMGQAAFAATWGGANEAYYPNGFYFNVGAAISNESIDKLRLNTKPAPIDPLMLVKKSTSDTDAGYVITAGYAAKS